MADESQALKNCQNLLAIGRFELARKTALESLTGDPSDGDLLMIAAQCTGELEGWEAAEPQFRRAAAATPSFGNRIVLAHAVGRAGMVEESVTMFEALLAEAPEGVLVRKLYADVVLSNPSMGNESTGNESMGKESTGNDDAALLRVEQLVTDLLRLVPDDAGVHFTQARLHTIRNRWDDAKAATERGLAIDPQNTRGLQYLAGLRFIKSSGAPETFESLQSAIRADPTHKRTAQMLELAKMQQILDEVTPAIAKGEAQRKKRARSYRANGIAIWGCYGALAGMALMVLGKVMASGGVQTVGLTVVLVCFAIAMAFMIVADRSK